MKGDVYTMQSGGAFQYEIVEHIATLREAASLYERRASESLQRLRAASNGLEGLKASRIWQAVASALELAEMALERG